MPPITLTAGVALATANVWSTGVAAVWFASPGCVASISTDPAPSRWTRPPETVAGPDLTV